MLAITGQPSLYAIVGGPGAGKSEIIGEVKKISEETHGYAMNFFCVDEAAKDLIKQEQERGNSNPFAIPGFERRIYDEKIERENQATQRIQKAPQHQVALVDRGLLDNIVYIKRFGGEGSEIDQYVKGKAEELGVYQGRYRAIFLVEPWNGTFKNDSFSYRAESPKACTEIHEELKTVYQSAVGPKTPMITVEGRVGLSAQQRAISILKKIKEIEYPNP